jgi:GNAT superfamily N-acetyltransferase
LIEIKILLPPYRPLDINVQANQSQFVNTIEQIFKGLKADQSAFVVQSNGVDVGFFTLSPSDDDEVEQLRSATRCTLRSFMLDSRHQGQGYAAKVLKQLKSLVRENFPHAESVGLTVNCRNTHAHTLYEKHGFHTLKDLYSGGSAGPQHIMIMVIGD